MIESTCTVGGMACDHCAAAIAEEIQLISGVTSVAVDVDGGTVTVTSGRGLDLAEVRAAADEAGYELTA